MNLTPWSRRVDAEPLKLPKFAKRINTRLKDLLTQHAIDGPVCHVGSLINRDDATPDDARKWRTNFSSLANNEFVGIDIFPGVNVDVVADLCAPDLFERHARFKGYFGLIFASALVENVFAYPGMGRLMLQSISMRDIPVVQAVTLAAAGIYALANLGSDLLYSWLNPKIRYS